MIITYNETQFLQEVSGGSSEGASKAHKRLEKIRFFFTEF